ncbi:hypothetical protein BGAL_0732g00030 [Botrytis galanthina]|uniref:Uncharacterized protein n=1 Tax=Botrytis galanthina TaxID=278940 RepID=A0A4V6T6T2_9HELO|nr:hypothetical protein BGAL_0732g00030 [Botrytis galanthina]
MVGDLSIFGLGILSNLRRGGAVETVHKLRGIVSTSILSKVLNGWAGDGPRDFDKSPIHA